MLNKLSEILNGISARIALMNRLMIVPLHFLELIRQGVGHWVIDGVKGLVNTNTNWRFHYRLHFASGGF